MRRRGMWRHRSPRFYTEAGPVTVRQADGSKRVQPPLAPKEYQQLLRSVVGQFDSAGLRMNSAFVSWTRSAAITKKFTKKLMAPHQP